MTEERFGRRGGSVGLPKVRYARSGDVNIAYQVVGDGPVDLVWAYGLASNIDVFWEEPSLAAFFRRLSEFSRLIIFDRRGCGLSDRGGTTTTPTLEERMDDVIAVLDAVGSERASILGISEGGALAALFGATHPDRTASIIVYGTMSRFVKDAEHPWGWGDENTLISFAEMVSSGWGMPNELAVQLWAPSMVGDERFIDWIARYCRQSVSRDAVLPLISALGAYDLVDVFPAVRVPALVVHREGDRLVPVAQGRRIAQEIPDARLVELPGDDHLPFVGDAESVLAEIEDFLVGSRGTAPRRRKLLTVAFTDIADSTAQVAKLGDETWRELLASHDAAIRAHLARFGGEEVKQTGDGFLAVFDGPARAIRCSLGIVDAAERLGLSVRVGLHTGECEVDDSDVSGVAVHVASRIMDLAEPDQILVSSTVRDLVAGSGIRFGEARDVELDGLAGARSVLAVLSHGASPDAVRRLAIDQTNLVRREGEYWTVAYDGVVVAIRDTKGMRDIARLLAAPGKELHVLDLAAEGGLSLDGGRADDPVIDDVARAEYKRRLEELERDIDDAEARGDGEAGAKAKEERDTLVEELTAAYGLGGRPRQSPDHVERARKAVTRRIRDTLGRIERAHPRLGRHLDVSLRTGAFCAYAPERDAAWTIELG